MSASRTAAEDIAQEVFLSLLKAPERFDPARGSLRTFLMAIARNLVLKRCPRLLISGLGASHLAQRYTFWSGYYRRAMWQGAHLAFLRDFTNCLVVSAYHGRRFRSLVSQTDYHRAVQRDIRPEIGRRLLGAPVKYPATNPGPPPSRFRLGIADIGRFLETARRHGLIHDEGRLVA